MTTDSGLFQCFASNAAGSVQAAANLKVITNPGKSINFKSKRTLYASLGILTDYIIFIFKLILVFIKYSTTLNQAGFVVSKFLSQNA